MAIEHQTKRMATHAIKGSIDKRLAFIANANRSARPQKKTPICRPEFRGFAALRSWTVDALLPFHKFRCEPRKPWCHTSRSGPGHIIQEDGVCEHIYPATVPPLQSKPEEVQKRRPGSQTRSKNEASEGRGGPKTSTEDQGSPQIWLQEQARGRQRKTKNKVFTPRHGRNTQAIKAAKNAPSNSTSTFSSCRCQARTPGLGYRSCCLAGFSHRMSSIQHPNRTRRLLRSTLKALWRTSLFDSSPGTK